MLNAILRKCTLYSDRDVEKKNNTQTQDAKQSEKRSHFFSFVPAKSERKFSRAPRTHTRKKAKLMNTERGIYMVIYWSFGRIMARVCRQFLLGAHTAAGTTTMVWNTYLCVSHLCVTVALYQETVRFSFRLRVIATAWRITFFILLWTKEERLRKRYNVASMKREREHYFVLAVISVNYFSKICFPI